MWCEGSLFWYLYLKQIYQVAANLLLDEGQQKSEIVMRGNKWGFKENSSSYGETYSPFKNATFSAVTDQDADEIYAVSILGEPLLQMSDLWYSSPCKYK